MPSCASTTCRPTAAGLSPTSTVHAAFHKAAHLFGLDLVLIDVDPSTFRADPDAMAAALTERTVLVDKGVLRTRKDANRVFYRVGDVRTLEVVSLIREVFCGF